MCWGLQGVGKVLRSMPTAKIYATCWLVLGQTESNTIYVVRVLVLDLAKYDDSCGGIRAIAPRSCFRYTHTVAQALTQHAWVRLVWSSATATMIM